MKITNLTPGKYKRFFAFGCSFTNYLWPTWADIISKDVDVYQNWGQQSFGNHYIFNSIMEADARYHFTKDDLVMVMWSTKEREDRYSNGKWLAGSAMRIEEVYSKDWIEQFGMDERWQLIRDFALMKSAHAFFKTLDCDWASLSMTPLFRWDDEKVSLLDKIMSSKAEKLAHWVKVSESIYAGGPVPDLIKERDIVELYKPVLADISYNFDSYSYKTKYSRKPINNNDLHPTPSEALEFIDTAWPDNELSPLARAYAKYWNSELFARQVVKSPIHDPKPIVRL